VFWANLYNEDDVDLTGFGAGIVGKKNFGAENEGFFIDGRIGVARLTADVVGDEATSTKPYFGVGVGYDFSDKVGAGIRYTRYTGDFEGADVDADTLTAALEIRF
jgi:hypothetical protein